MDYLKLLEISDDWLKYAICLNLEHEPKDNFTVAYTGIQGFPGCRFLRKSVAEPVGKQP